jgi:HAD superfamily hydrolase (TIGR01509 family)
LNDKSNVVFNQSGVGSVDLSKMPVDQEIQSNHADESLEVVSATVIEHSYVYYGITFGQTMQNGVCRVRRVCSLTRFIPFAILPPSFEPQGANYQAVIQANRCMKTIWKEIQAVAFDCDGVMFDSSKANRAYYNQLLQSFGMPELNSSQFAYVHSHSVEDCIAYLFKDPAMRSAAQGMRKKMGYHRFLSLMTIEPHLKSTLHYLRPGYKTAVATNRTDTMDDVISTHGLQGYFDKVVSARDVAKPKPHPDLLHKVATLFELTPQQVVYVGDSDLDEIAARAARMPFIAYGNPDLEADWHIERLCELEELL